MAWSCSEWLEESSLANEAAHCVASALLRNVCVCVRSQVWGVCVRVENHIHLVFCCSTTQLLAAVFGRVKSFE